MNLAIIYDKYKINTYIKYEEITIIDYDEIADLPFICT